MDLFPRQLTVDVVGVIGDIKDTDGTRKPTVTKTEYSQYLFLRLWAVVPPTQSPNQQREARSAKAFLQQEEVLAVVFCILLLIDHW